MESIENVDDVVYIDEDENKERDIKPIKHVGYDPNYIYFCKKSSVFRLKKEYCLQHKRSKDLKFAKEMKEYNNKLFEKIFEIPERIYDDTRLYVICSDGWLYDYSEKLDNIKLLELMRIAREKKIREQVLKMLGGNKIEI